MTFTQETYSYLCELRLKYYSVIWDSSSQFFHPTFAFVSLSFLHTYAYVSRILCQSQQFLHFLNNCKNQHVLQSISHHSFVWTRNSASVKTHPQRRSLFFLHSWATTTGRLIDPKWEINIKYFSQGHNDALPVR